jgi:hypothetical protein
MGTSPPIGTLADPGEHPGMFSPGEIRLSIVLRRAKRSAIFVAITEWRL